MQGNVRTFSMPTLFTQLDIIMLKTGESNLTENIINIKRWSAILDRATPLKQTILKGIYFLHVVLEARRDQVVSRFTVTKMSV